MLLLNQDWPSVMPWTRQWNLGNWVLNRVLSIIVQTLRRCEIYLILQKFREINYMGFFQTPISWDMDISKVEGDKIKVEVQNFFPVTTSISHNFVRKTFFSLAFCEICKRLLFQVSYDFHKKISFNFTNLRIFTNFFRVFAAELVDASFIKGVLIEYQNFVNRSGCKKS